MKKRSIIGSVMLLISLLLSSCEFKNDESNKTSQKNEFSNPLPSWNEATSKQNIIAYVDDITNSESENFIVKKR